MSGRKRDSRGVYKKKVPDPMKGNDFYFLFFILVGIYFYGRFCSLFCRLFLNNMDISVYSYIFGWFI
jgi:hypothetical protein